MGLESNHRQQLRIAFGIVVDVDQKERCELEKETERVRTVRAAVKRARQECEIIGMLRELMGHRPWTSFASWKRIAAAMQCRSFARARCGIHPILRTSPRNSGETKHQPGGFGTLAYCRSASMDDSRFSAIVPF